ncbi:MAG: hypothetical protein LT081_14145, partial [Hydrogenophaga sp.]|nr:hypothetical protein [Hydrogenophaga sp.]
MNPSPSRSGSGRRPDVIVRGAGIVGQTLALLLARDRLKVALVKPPRATPGAPDVRAYAINSDARALLQSVRAWPGDGGLNPGHDAELTPSVTPVTAMEVHG